MSCKDMGAKLKLILAKLQKTGDEFVDFIHRDQPEIRKDVARNWFSKDNCEMRGKIARAFVTFCGRNGIPFDMGDFSTSAAEFERKLNNMPRFDTKELVLPPDTSSELVGRYQIIRPYVTNPEAYVLEAMEIERHDDGLRHLLVSHNQRDPRFLYKGKVAAEPRYYFTLLSRPHESYRNASAHRCITFYTEVRYDACLSGVMLRGVSGADGKYATALPFIALRIPDAVSLHSMNQVAIKSSAPGAEPLYRLHPDSNLLVGEARKHWHKPVFDICDAVFSNERFLRGTNNSVKETHRQPPLPPIPPMAGDPVLKTVVPDVLKGIPQLNHQSWLEAIKAIS